MKKLAVIGSGISGLACAYFLKDKFEVTLFEKNNYFGGHSNTVEIESKNKIIPVDTGFIVFNHQTYPNLVPFFEHLNIDTAPSNMGFGISVNSGEIEYSSNGLNGFFAQKESILRPRMWRLIYEIQKFNKHAKNISETNLLNYTIDQFLSSLKLSDAFRELYLYPMAGAIWSTPVKDIGQFPAYTLVRFFKNHALLSLTNHHPWYTVVGGSREYVKRVVDSPTIDAHLNSEIRAVERVDGCVHVHVEKQKYIFDHVVIASSAPIALSMLQTPSAQEQDVLGCFRYSKNLAYLHKDASLMPKNKKAWSSWSYFSTKENKIGVTYWMNKLQPLATDENIFVTLNPSHPPKKHQTLKVQQYDHPLFDAQAILAQDKITDIQGKGNVWFCGAYQRYGFHEDGIWSALRVINRLGVKAPWQ